MDLVLAPKLARKNQDPECAGLGRLVKRPVWVGAYFGSPVPGARSLGYFLSFPLGNDRAGPDHEMAFTATIDVNNAANLPAKTDPALQEFLRQTSAILRSITYK